MKRLIVTGFLLLFVFQCGGAGGLAEPLLVSAGFGVKDGPEFKTESPQALKEINFVLPDSDGKIEEPNKETINASPKVPTKGSFLILSFSRLFDGNSIETVQTIRSVGEGKYKNKIPVVTDFEPVSGVIQIEQSSDANNWNLLDKETYLVSYRPEGGFVPKLDVPVYLNPAPAIRIDLAKDKSWPTGTYIRVKLTNKFKDKNADSESAALLIFKTESG